MQNFFYSLICLVFSVKFIYIKSHCTGYLDTLNATFNPKFVQGRLWADYGGKNNDDHTKYSTNVDINVTQPGINYIKLYLKAFKHPRGKPEERSKMIDISVDVCDFLKKSNGMFLIADMYKFFGRFGKVATKCPIKPDHYYLRNVSYKEAKSFPAFFSGQFVGDFQTMFLVDIFVKYNKNKHLYTMIKVNMTGGFKNLK